MKQLFVKRRILSLIVAVAIILSGVPVTAAAEGGTASGGCVHEHDDTCGYIEAADCTHECGEDCADGCVHEHDDACGYMEAADCTHEHDEDCGGLAQDSETGDEPGDGLTDGTTGGGLILDGGDGESCVCAAFCDDLDCPVCKDDHTQCAFYYCVCEALCGGDSINPECPVCKDDYTKCVQAVDVPELQALAGDETWNGGTQSKRTITGPATITVTGEVTVTGELTISGNVTISGGMLKRGAECTGDLITVKNGASLTLNGVTIDGGNGGNSSRGGSLVLVENGGTLTMNDGTVLRNNVEDDVDLSGCGVRNEGTFNMNGGTISDNDSAGWGGGVYNYGGTFNMRGGEIKGNTAICGGGVFNDGGEFNMSGGTISGNTADTRGGGVSNNGTFTISGSPQIVDNKQVDGDEYPGGVYLWGENTIAIDTDGLTGGALIGIEGMDTTDPGATVATNAADGYLQYFYISNFDEKINGYDLVYDNGEIKLATVQQYYISSNGDDNTGDGTYANPYKTIAKAYEKVPSGGEILVMDEITVSTVISLSSAKTVTLKSNGATAQVVKRGVTGNLITVSSGVTLILENITIDGNKDTYSNANGVLVHVDGGTFTMNDGAVLRNNTRSQGITGGGVNVASGTFTMNGGIISGNGITNDMGNGGGVRVGDGTFTMNGGTIRENTATFGGGVIVGGGTFTMNGGEISGNTATDSGGGVRTVSGTFNMNGGTILGNTASTNGGGVSNSDTFTVGANKVIITGNKKGTDANAPLNNVQLGNGKFITLTGALHADTRIGVTTATAPTATTPVTITSGSGTGYPVAANFVSDSVAYETILDSVNNVIKLQVPPTYGISLDPATDKDFGTVAYGYAAQTAHSVTVNNTGNQATGNLTVALSGANSGCFTLSAGSISSIAANGNDSFTVKPNDGLAAGTYAATVTVSGTNITSQSFNVSFTVTAAPITSAAITVNAPVVAAVPATGAASGGTGYTCSLVSWTYGSGTAAGTKFLGGTQYTATVTLTANSGYTFTSGLSTATINGYNATVINNGSTATLSYQFPATTAATLTGITVTTQPDSLSYTSGGTLALAGLVATLTYNDGTTNNVAFADFGTNGLTASPANGTPLNVSHDGTKVTVTHTATGNTAQTSTLTVSKATPSGSWPSGLTATYGQVLSEISLASYTSLGGVAGTFTWETPTDKVGNAGVQSHNMTFEPDDSTNYNNATNSVSVTVGARSISNAAVNVSGTYTYDGTAKTPVPTVTDSGAAITTSDYDVSYSNNTNVGQATVTLTGKGNYTGTSTANFTINPATVNTAALIVTPPGTGEAKTDASVDAGAKYTHTSTAWTLTGTSTAAGASFAASTAYTATITLTAKTNYVFGTVLTGSVTGAGGTVISAATSPNKSTLTIVVNYPATAAKSVRIIAVTTQPANTTYYSGDTLDVAGLVVTATYYDGTTEVVTPDGYSINGKDFTPGITVLTSTQNGKPITVSYNGITATTGNLTVKKPPVISNVTVTGITISGATISYTVTGGTATLEYRTGSGVWTAATNRSPITGLTPGTAYQYRITASDGTKDVTYTGGFQTLTAVSAGITVEGDVYDETSPAPIILVTLEHGNTVISSVQAAGAGTTNTYHFSFSNVPNGVYNLVVDNGSWKVTQTVTIVNRVVTDPLGGNIRIDMSTGKTQSIVDIVTPDTPPAAVGGLPELFTDPAIYTAEDEEVVAASGTVEIKLVVEKQDAPLDAGKIDNAASGQAVGLYLNLSVIKSQFDNAGDLLDETKLANLNGNLITITFELPDELKNQSNLTIYRVHNGVAEKLPPNPNPYNEAVDISGNIVTLKVCKFSTYALTYTPSNTNPPNPPLSGGGSSSGRGGGSSTVASTYWIEVPEAKTMAKAAKEKQLDYVRSRRATITGIRKNALLALTGLHYQHDTVIDNAVQVRVYVDDPAKATKDILVSGYVKGDSVDKVKARFEKWFQNKVAVVGLDQQGDFGIQVQIAAKIDLSGMDANNLYFYSYDSQTNKYKQIRTEYRIDINGYLHFATWLAGNIIVSNGPLSKDAQADEITLSDLQDPQNPETGGDGVTMPPTQVDTQNPGTGEDSLFSIYNAGILKLKNVDTNNDSGVAVFDLGTSVAQDTLSDSLNRDKVSVYVVISITSVLLLAAMMLWTTIPRKNNPLVYIKDYREKH